MTYQRLHLYAFFQNLFQCNPKVKNHKPVKLIPIREQKQAQLHNSNNKITKFETAI